nr:MAG TPA: hypothetical protein [Caudoviricetes sp.]
MLSMLDECLHVGRSGYCMLSTRVSIVYSCLTMLNTRIEYLRLTLSTMSTTVRAISYC